MSTLENPQPVSVTNDEWLRQLVGEDKALQQRAMNYLNALADRLVGQSPGAFSGFATVPGSGYARLASDAPVKVHVDGNGFDQVVASETASVIVSLFTWSWLAHDCAQEADRDVVDDVYYNLRYWALQREDASEILAAID